MYLPYVPSVYRNFPCLPVPMRWKCYTDARNENKQSMFAKIGNTNFILVFSKVFKISNYTLINDTEFELF